jgi:hypothetical protein
MGCVLARRYFHDESPVKAPTPRWSRDARASAGCCAVLGGLAPTPHRYYPAAERSSFPQMRGRVRAGDPSQTRQLLFPSIEAGIEIVRILRWLPEVFPQNL